MVPSLAEALAAPNVMLHWPRLGELNSQRPAIAVGGAEGCEESPAGLVLDPAPPTPSVLQAASARLPSRKIDARNAGPRSCMRCNYFIVGMTNSAPSLVP